MSTFFSDHARAVQVGVFTFALLVVLAFLALETVGRPQQERRVWVVTQGVAAGVALDGSVRQQSIPATRDAFSFFTGDIKGKLSARRLSAGDVLRDDDIEDQPFATVPVKLTGATVAAGDIVDIYAVQGSKVVLVARGYTMQSATSVRVPASDEPLWVAMFGSSTTLIASRSNGTGVVAPGGVTATDATAQLAAIAQAGSAATVSPSPR